MRKYVLLIICFTTLHVSAQDTSLARNENIELPQKEIRPTWIFYSSRLINAKTVHMLQKGILDFRISHNFGDIGGERGGIKNFWGIDNALDIRIAFEYGINKRLNVVAARYKGAVQVNEIYELGLKWLALEQAEGGHPISLALYANEAIATMTAGTNPENENAISDDFSDRLSNLFQLMLARKFGKRLSLQVSPTFVHRNFALPYDENNLFALGGAMRLHLGGRYSLLFDYFHTFRSQSSIDSFKVRGINFYDAVGVGFEILTEGHVFHLNFTNTMDLLENRFIPRTTSSWGKGEFRWSFTISRDFDLFWKKKARGKK